jgi:CDP-diacylglycerol--glycerol-3-phosphate 3-phosphatidyltransferase
LILEILLEKVFWLSKPREWMAEIGARSQVAVSPFGKIKTILQMVGLGAMLYLRPIWGMDVYTFGLVLLMASAALTLWSMIEYLRAAWPSLNSA